MSNDSCLPYSGPQTIDLSPVASLLVDMASGALRGLQREKPGIDMVAAELASSVPMFGVKASISADVYTNFTNWHDLIMKIRTLRLLVEKVAEVLAESEAYYEDQREIAISLIVMAVRTSAQRKDESIRAAFEKTLTYNAQTAMKAVKTRRKNAEAKAGDEGEGEGGEAGSTQSGGSPEGSSPAGTP